LFSFAAVWRNKDVYISFRQQFSCKTATTSE